MLGPNIPRTLQTPSRFRNKETITEINHLYIQSGIFKTDRYTELFGQIYKKKAITRGYSILIYQQNLSIHSIIKYIVLYFVSNLDMLMKQLKASLI